ncbi:MAG: hypothetical protein LKJ76_09140 [Lachnospiraceae bacterium]|jgi:hypothetical protein|nr:hypothetical protein [Lachnospiraceae bacterium]
MDIQAEAKKVISKIAGDPSLISGFQSDPTGTVKKIVGEAVSEKDLGAIVAEVRKNGLNAAGASGAAGILGGLFK